MGLRLGVLGPIRIDGATEARLRRPSHKRLLSILALDVGRPIHTDLLIDRFWRGDPPATAKAAIQTHISALRRLLGRGSVTTEGQSYILDLSDEDIDFAIFQHLSGEARASADRGDWEGALNRTEEALDLWRGEPFSELRDDDFARPQVIQLEESRLELLELRGDALLALGRNDELLPDLEQLAAEHPLRERLWEQLMTARYRLGRHTDALRAFQEVSATLAGIGVEPGENLQRLEEKILLHDRSLLRSPDNLPVELDSFIGRERETEEVNVLVAHNRLVTLTGAGGSGKTRLAINVARQLTEAFTGRWVVELADLRQPELIATEIAVSMRLRPEGADVLGAIADAIRSETHLIVLDNCEHLLHGVAHVVQELLREAPGLKVVATSREPLRVRGESVYVVPGMALPDPDVSSVHSALAYEAVKLFDRRASAALSAFHIDESNLDAVVSVCRNLDGMPLAIELAAGQVRALSLREIAERTETNIEILRGGSSTAPPRHQTLEATIEWSYLLLDNTERVVLNRLGVFSGGFGLGAAEQVISGRGIPQERVVQILSSLVDKSLVSRYLTKQGSRYRLLETVRQYVKLRLDESGEGEELRRRQQRWCLSLVEGLWSRALGRGQHELAALLEAEADNLQTALGWSRSSSDADAVVRLSQALGWHWYLTGHHHNSVAVLKTGLEMANRSEAALMRALMAWALAYADLIEEAFPQATAALSSLESLEDPLTKAWAIATVQMTHFLSVESDPALMLPLAEAAIQVVHSTDDIYAEIWARQVVADAYCWNGRTTEGLGQQRIVLDSAAATGDPMTINRVFGQSFYNYMFDPETRRTESPRIVEEWLSLVPLGPEAWQSVATDWLPWIYMQSGDFEQAEESLTLIAGRTMVGYNQSAYLIPRCTLAYMRGDLDGARSDIEELDRRGFAPRWAHSTYPLMAEIYAELSMVEQVRETVDRHLELTVHSSREATKLGVLNPLVRAEVDLALESGSADSERAGEALATMREILATHPPLVESWETALTHRQNLAFAEAEVTRLNRPDPEKWRQALALADYAYYRIYSRMRLAQALFESGEESEATTELRHAYGEARKVGTDLLARRIESTAERRSVDLS